MYIKITSPPEGDATNRWLDLNVTNEQHHKMKCISSSSTKYFASGKSPYSFYKNCILKERAPFEPNEAFRIGTLAHLAILEPEKFEKSVVICDLNQATNEFKEFKRSIASPPEVDHEELDKLIIAIQSIEKELSESTSKEQTKVVKEKLKKARHDLVAYEKFHPVEEYTIRYSKDGGILTEDGKEIFIVKSEEMKMYRAYQSQVEKHPRLSFMLTECVFEQSGVAQDPETGLWLSVRGDARCPRGYFIDPKTMADEITVDNIQKYAVNFHLLLQDAHYTYTANLIEPGAYKKFFFVMLSKKAPYEIAFVQFDKEDRAWAMNRFKEILHKITQCEQTGKWPTLDAVNGHAGLTINLPAWGKR
jgi:hypothetical protein